MKKTTEKPKKIEVGEKVGVIQSMKGLTIEVQILDNMPEEKELLIVEGYPEVFLEVGFFRAGAAGFV